ncbi:MAG: DUF3137 domain-containing protein [Sphingobacteriales bacterium]|nr:MAG: DUF3137 domain-containing protein [Sphingobacteriales bacterium]
MPTNEHYNIKSSPDLFENQEYEEQIQTDFHKFYDDNLKPFLAGLERDAQTYKNWKHYTIGTAILSLIFLLLYQFFKVESGILIGLSLLLITGVGIYFTTKKNEKFIDDFKEQIIARIIKHISPQAVYKPLKYLSKKEYLLSGLYRRRFTQYDGDDYWKSSYRGVNFHCSELLVRYEDAAMATTIFQGLFIEAEISHIYNSGTYVWTKNAAQLPTSMADENYRMYPLPGIQKFTNCSSDFKESFSVYSNNLLKTAVILTPVMQSKMLLLKQKTGRDIVFSFVNGKCFVAIPMEENLLEPTTRGLQDKESYKKYFFTFLLVFNVIQELELNKLQ